MTAGIAMIDLDDFKIYNDTFGHDAGDLALTDSCRNRKGECTSY